MRLEPFRPCPRRPALPPAYSAAELAREFGVPLRVLVAYLRRPDAPKHVVGPVDAAKRHRYRAHEVRTWWKEIRRA